MNSGHGNSQANLLYHSMAMGQVLSAPPTLARWQHHGPWHHFRTVFAAPMLVYGWVVYTDFETRARGAIYDVNVKLLLTIEVMLALSLLGLCVAATLQSRAMAMRWESAFFAVNPHRAKVQQMSLWQWLSLGPRNSGRKSLRKWATTALVDALREKKLTSQVSPDTVNVQVTNGRILRKHIREATDRLEQAASNLITDQMPRLSGEFSGFTRFSEANSTLSGDTWTISGICEFEYTAKATKSKKTA